MKEKQDYIRDLDEIRSMMERSSKFLSLSGWAGIMAGIYALAGAHIAYRFYNFNPQEIFYNSANTNLPEVYIIALLVLVLAVGTAIILSYQKAKKRKESIWNTTSRLLLVNMAVPLAAGGILILILISKDIIGLIAPITLLFYGLALYNTSKFTYDALKFLGIIQIALGLISSYFIEYSIIIWAIGFGIVHIAYGIYIYFRYER